MKTLIFLLLLIASSAQAVCTDSQKFMPLGRAIENRKSGETLQWVCLEEIDAQGVCHQIALRQNGDQLIGMQIHLHSVPKKEFAAELHDGATRYYGQREWDYRVPLVDFVTYTVVPIFSPDCFIPQKPKGLGVHILLTGGGALALMNPAGLAIWPGALVTSFFVGAVVTKIQRTITRIQDGRTEKLISKLTKQMFIENLAKENPKKLSDRNFNIIGGGLKALVNAGGVGVPVKLRDIEIQ